ncbi:methionyl-tRNA formyltransferase, mitochondrial [Diorhabda sublineata]|uniref:methionyl-tRNA formyltransferase, mitochondrial n=1 Tax=Diorhabda sublineata TaxID=1163346 RepID=UPI0024E10842|nr:methionyl-tRNA formyltransferase, mitochondrial [Diorhabda sublineata]
MIYLNIGIPIRIKISVLPIRYFASKPPWSVLFFGTDQFSLYTLKSLNNLYSKSKLIKKLDVVTSFKQNANAIQIYAKKYNLPLYNWPNVPEETVYDVGLVVSFGYLIPERIIKKFSYGILNVHASLLPRWRGAAPIIHAIANGDKETGITIMRIKPYHFDIGEILLQEKVPIGNDTEMPDLYQQLGELGAKYLIKSLENLSEYIKNAKCQSSNDVTYAPKITHDFTTINWFKMTSVQVYNLYRALRGYLVPVSTWQGVPIKLLEIKLCSDVSTNCIDKYPGYVMYDKRTKSLKVLCGDKSFVTIGSVGIFSKRIMNATDFSNGYLKKVPLECRYFK